MKKVFITSLFLSSSAFAQTFVEGMGKRKLTGYFCVEPDMGSTGIEKLFGVLNGAYDKFAIYAFAIFFILFFWEMIQTFVKKDFRWTQKNDFAKWFGGLVFLGLFLNVMAPKNYSSSSYYDVRNPKIKVSPCTKDSLSARYIPKQYLRKSRQN